MKHIFPYLILLLATVGVAAIARAQHRRGVYAPLAAWWRGASRLMRCLVTVLVLTAVAYGADKILGGHIGEGMRTLGGAVASLCTNIFTTGERLTGYAASSVRTNETHDLTMPANAQIAERIARRGAHDDGFWFFDAYTNRLARDGLDLGNPVWIHTDGTVTLRSPAPGVPIQELVQTSVYSNITVYAPLQGSYGFLPASKWPDFMPSLIWIATTDRGSRVVTWEGARQDRDVSRPVSFQAEFHEDGEVTYRYNPAQTNFVGIGLFRNGAALTFGLSDLQDQAGPTTNHLPLTTLHLSYIGDLGDGSGDTDDDGLTDWEEVKRYHTDPHDADTDGDGLVDGYEVQNGTDPLNPDSNGDGMPDGWSQEQYAAHRLFNGQEGDRTVIVSLLASTPASNRAVLRIGDMPILLCETNSWTFSIPTGTVWNVELRTDGLPVQLAIEAGVGIFADNAEDVFASSLLEEEQQANMPSNPTDPQPPPGGSRGGGAKLYAPCIFLEPAMKAIHSDETVTVCAKCIPDTPSLVGGLNWSFDPDYMSNIVEVADNKMSATVSNMDEEWHSSVTLHATKGNSLSTSAIVYFCSGHDGCPTNQISFPPNHTNVTINPVFRKCDHPFNDVIGDGEDEPTCFLEVEAGRETAAGWQHLAWIDTDPGTSGVQRRTAISRDTPPALNWNMKADTAQPLSDGTDSFVYDDKTTFACALPAVTAGQYVPPPFATIISRTFDDKDNLISEFSTTLAIPQYVKITWTSAVLEEFRQPISYRYVGSRDLPPTNVTLFAGCMAAEAASAFSNIAATVQNIFPPAANIIVVGPDADVPQPHKTIVIQSGKYKYSATGGYSGDLGRTPNEHCHQRNDSPSGMAYVFDGTIRQYIYNCFKAFYLDIDRDVRNEWKDVPVPLTTDLLATIFAQVAMHESCHAMGLVPTASSAHNGHNKCVCGKHFMDRGKDKYAPMRLGVVPQYVQRWMTNNTDYLEFVFPKVQ